MLAMHPAMINHGVHEELPALAPKPELPVSAVAAAFVATVLLAVWIKFGLVLTVFMELGHRGRSWLLPTLLILGLGLVAFGFLLV